MADYNTAHLATDDFVFKQKIVYELLSHVDQPEIVNSDLYREGKKWDIQANNKSYDSETVVTDFWNKFNNLGMLPRGEIFSVFYPEILDEAIALFRLFRSAVDFQTFWKTAAWARIHINEGQFIYAFSVAVVHRPDTRYVKLPTPDEINPHFFFDTKVIAQSHLIKMKHLSSDSGFQKPYVIAANPNFWYTRPQGDPEHKLNYFIEDVGLNTYYYILNLEFPFWMSSDEFNLPKGYRGEKYYYALKLLLTRYNLERLSNDLDEIEDIEWNQPITMGYLPFMTYPNGEHFPQRYHNSMIPPNKYKDITEMKILEARILEVIDSGFYTDIKGERQSIYTPEGFEFLGNLIEGNADSINEKLYRSIDFVGRNILGFNPDPLSKYKILPSALQHFSTSLRDPGFYRLYKKIVGYFYRYKSNIAPYTPEQLGFSSGLKIDSVIFDKLETYFDYSDSIIDNAVTVCDDDDANSFVIKARQYRLNHKPFFYKIIIDSKEETSAMVRIFLGPKYNVFHEELDITENYNDYYEFDTWKVDLKVGRNEIKRYSHEAHFVLPDQEGKDDYYKKVKMASEKREPLAYSEHVYGFPSRLLIPKGRREGMAFRVFTHVTPFAKDQISEIDSPLWGKTYVDGQPMGYPLDRPMKSNYYKLENMNLRDVIIFHKEAGEMNVTM